MNTFNADWFEQQIDAYFWQYGHPPECAMMGATMFWYYFEDEPIPRTFRIYNSRAHGPIIIRPSPYLHPEPNQPARVVLCNAAMATSLSFNTLYESPAPIENEYADWTPGPDDAPMPTL